MVAFIVVAPPAIGVPLRTGLQLNIFPGSATPSIFPARTPFWIGYSFVVDLLDVDGPRREIAEGTRFELEVDGVAVLVLADVTADGEGAAAKLEIASFAAGLPAGWHRFMGRWYDGGCRVLTCDTTIEFVER